MILWFPHSRFRLLGLGSAIRRLCGEGEEFTVLPGRYHDQVIGAWK
jgi:hypothetical protein